MIELKEGEALSTISNRFRTLFKYLQYNSTININSANDFTIIICSILAHNIYQEGIYPFIIQLRAVLCIYTEKQVSVRHTNGNKVGDIIIECTDMSSYELAKILREVNIDFDRYISNTKNNPYRYYLPLIDKRNTAINDILND